jgi:hypothetical protein
MRSIRSAARGRDEATPARLMLGVGTVVFLAVAAVALVAALLWALL